MDEDAIATFCSITGVAPAVAEHYLEAMGNDLDRALNFFLEGNQPEAQGHMEQPDSPQRADDLATAHDEQMARALAEDTGARFGGQQQSIDLTNDEEDLQRALAASLAGTSEAPGPSRPRIDSTTARPTRIQEPDEGDFGGMHDDDDEDDINVLAQHRQQAQAQAEAREAQRTLQDMMNMTRSMLEAPFPGGMPSLFPGMPGVQGTGIPAARAGGRHRAAAADEDDEDDVMRDDDEGFGARRRRSGRAAASAQPQDDDDHLAGIDGIDRRELEEARMLEAALLGRPYEGRMPDFTRQPSASRTVNPEHHERASLRWEQDQAYEESLAADRAKAEAAARVRREAEEAERAARLAAEAEEKRKAEEERARQEEERRTQEALERKAASLPSEPSAGEPDSITIMVRMPDGGRQSRRFRKGDTLQAVFDFIDVQHNAATFKPGTYKLINSYPRKVFEDGTASSLADAGIVADTALFLEPKT